MLPGLLAWAIFQAGGPPALATVLVVVLGGGLFLALCLAIAVGMTRGRLEVSPQGISYYSLGYQVVTP